MTKDLKKLLEVNDKICLTCKYSYFREMSEEGWCHNKNIANGVLPAKVKDEHHCPYWEPKQNENSEENK